MARSDRPSPGLLFLAIVLAASMPAASLAAEAPATAPDSPAADFPFRDGWGDAGSALGPLISNEISWSGGELDSQAIPAGVVGGDPLPSPTPEPATATFLALGSVVLIWSTTRRRRKNP